MMVIIIIFIMLRCCVHRWDPQCVIHLTTMFRLETISVFFLLLDPSLPKCYIILTFKTFHNNTLTLFTLSFVLWHY